ncbi:MAG: adenylate/guanylate cyclase domain-containing protein [Myxococcales bacterium]
MFPGEGVAPAGFVMVAVTCLFGVGWSVWTLRTPKAGVLSPEGRLIASAAVDHLVITLSLLGVTLWPFSGYAGMLRYPGIAVFGVATAAAGLRLSVRVALVSAGLGLVGQLLLLIVDRQLHPLPPIGLSEAALLTVGYVGAVVLGYVVAARTRLLVFQGARAALDAERARQHLGIYVSEEVAQTALASATLSPGGGRRQKVAVLFCDLRGFTRYSTQVPPEKLLAELNDYLAAMMLVIRDEGGFVDKFIGDAIMVVFGYPGAMPHDAARAVRTADRMQEALAAHNRERAARRLPPFEQGIGVHFGEAVIGHLGNRERLQFTMIGDAVNLASRLETATKQVKAPVVLSEEVVAAVRKAPDGLDLSRLSSLGRIEVRGRDGEVEVFTLMPKDQVGESLAS